MGRPQALVLSLVVATFVSSCDGSPAGPDGGPLATGRWTGDGACLSVTDTGCNFVVGCGHGLFPRPSLHANRSFDVSGTYRIEAGPIAIEPAPPAQFEGSVSGSRLTLSVVPSVASLSSASYSMTLTGTGTCVVPCV